MDFRKRQTLFFAFLNAVGWLWFLAFPVLFIVNDRVSVVQVLSSWNYWFFAMSFVIVYYLNAYVWFPYILKRKQYVFYTLSLLLCSYIFSAYIKPFDKLMQLERRVAGYVTSRPTPPPFEQRLRPDERFGPPPAPRLRLEPAIAAVRLDVASVYIFFTVIALGTLVRIIQYWIVLQQKVNQSEFDKASAELAFLKAQVHPHFLFNTLNNLYSLAIANSSATADSIYRLSQLMRYFINESKKDEVLLIEEVQALRDFIELQKLRTNDKCHIIEDYIGLEIPQYITPFILMPFVENAFKYGVSVEEQSELRFKLRVEEQSVEFVVINTIHQQKIEQPKSGLGIKNARRLLEYYYPDRFVLDISEGSGYFHVRLMLHISSE